MSAAEAIALSVHVGNEMRAHVGKGSIAEVKIETLSQWFPTQEEFQEALRLHALSQGWTSRRRKKAIKAPVGDYNPLPFELLMQEEESAAFDDPFSTGG